VIEGRQFDCQYFDKLNMTIKLTFETASFNFLADYGSVTGLLPKTIDASNLPFGNSVEE
jgi:hypothetical protein